AKARQRFVDLPLLAKDISQVVVRFGIIRFEFERLTNVSRPFVQVPLGLPDHTEAIVPFGKIGFEANGLAHELDSHVVFAILVGNQPEEMQRIDLTGVCLQDVAVGVFRLEKLAGLMILDAQGEKLLNSAHEDSFLTSPGRCGAKSLPPELAPLFSRNTSMI